MATSCSRWSDKAKGAEQPSCGTRELAPQGGGLLVDSVHLNSESGLAFGHKPHADLASCCTGFWSPAQRSVVTTFEPASAFTSIVGPIPAVSSDMSPMYCAAAPA